MGPSKEHRDRIDLGIAIAHATLKPGMTRNLDEIAAFCNCSRQAISIIEQRALRKLRRYFTLDDLLTLHRTPPAPEPHWLKA